MDPAEDFAARAEAYRRELRVHCYRLTGSFDEAEDLVQETLLHAWRSRDQLGDETGLRAWLYKTRPTPAWTSCDASSAARGLTRRCRAWTTATARPRTFSSGCSPSPTRFSPRGGPMRRRSRGR